MAICALLACCWMEEAVPATQLKVTVPVTAEKVPEAVTE
jgi:hypothetical protein